MKVLRTTFSVFWILSTLALGEEVAPPSIPASEKSLPSASSPSGTTDDKVGSTSPAQVSGEKQKGGSSKIRDRLKNENGKIATFALLTPIDYTTLNFSEIAAETLVTALAKYGDFPVAKLDDVLSSLTIDDFRKIVLRNKVDVVLVMILKPTNFDMFLFDRRTPYQIYAHSEILPESVQYQITKEVVEEYSKVILRRILYAFVQNQSYELPRLESAPILNVEIPRWIASTQSFQLVNREILSNYYGSASVGAALSMGNSSVWNSNLVGLQAGFRLFSNYFLELHADMFSYNALGLSIKYLANNLDSPFRFSFGLGAATTLNKYTLNWDQNHTQGLGGNYIVPSAAVLFPIVNLHLKVEGKVFLGMNGGMVFTLAPGLFFLF